jgi:hypothetical protein
MGKKIPAESFNENEMHLLRIACQSAAYLSRQEGHADQAKDFNDLLDKIESFLNLA